MDRGAWQDIVHRFTKNWTRTEVTQHARTHVYIYLKPKYFKQTQSHFQVLFNIILKVTCKLYQSHFINTLCLFVFIQLEAE